jgi:hypothetical protein
LEAYGVAGRWSNLAVPQASKEAESPSTSFLFCSVLFREEMKSHKLSDAPNFIENHFKMEHCI